MKCKSAVKVLSAYLDVDLQLGKVWLEPVLLVWTHLQGKFIGEWMSEHESKPDPHFSNKEMRCLGKMCTWTKQVIWCGWSHYSEVFPSLPPVGRGIRECGDPISHNSRIPQLQNGLKAAWHSVCVRISWMVAMKLTLDTYASCSLIFFNISSMCSSLFSSACKTQHAWIGNL